MLLLFLSIALISLFDKQTMHDKSVYSTALQRFCNLLAGRFQMIISTAVNAIKGHAMEDSIRRKLGTG
jgi:hypothetical protein